MLEWKKRCCVGKGVEGTRKGYRRNEMGLGRKMRRDFHGKKVRGLGKQMIVDLVGLKSSC